MQKEYNLQLGGDEYEYDHDHDGMIQVKSKW